jgi:hypothetical protein
VRSDIAESYSTTQVTIKDAVYNVHDPVKVAALQVHLLEAQREQLATVFSKRSISAVTQRAIFPSS